MLARLKGWARALKANLLVLWLAARDPQVPLGAKLLAGAVAAYAFSPVDLIPDFIPVLGLLDDLLLVPAGIWLALRLIPPAVLADLRAASEGQPWPGPSRAGLVLIAALWLGAALAAWLWWF